MISDLGSGILTDENKVVGEENFGGKKRHEEQAFIK